MGGWQPLCEAAAGELDTGLGHVVSFHVYLLLVVMLMDIILHTAYRYTTHSAHETEPMGLLGGEVGLEKHTTPPPKKKRR